MKADSQPLRQSGRVRAPPQKFTYSEDEEIETVGSWVGSQPVAEPSSLSVTAVEPPPPAQTVRAPPGISLPVTISVDPPVPAVAPPSPVAALAAPPIPPDAMMAIWMQMMMNSKLSQDKNKPSEGKKTKKKQSSGPSIPELESQIRWEEHPEYDVALASEWKTQVEKGGNTQGNQKLKHTEPVVLAMARLFPGVFTADSTKKIQTRFTILRTRHKALKKLRSSGRGSKKTQQ